MVERLFLAVPQGCLRFVIVVFPDHNRLLFWIEIRLDVFRKQGPTHIGPDLDPNGLILKVLLIFLLFFLKKVTSKKIRRRHF